MSKTNRGKLSVDQAWRVIKPQFENHLYETAIQLGARNPDIMDATDDEYSLCVTVGKIDLTATLAEESIREGEGSGLAVMIDAVSDEGRILAQFCPDNYTSELWLYDINALLFRLAHFDAEGLATAIKGE